MFKNIASTFGIKFLIAIINLLVVILLSRIIGAAGKGDASIIITTISIIGIVSSFIGGATLVYLVPRNNLFQLLFISHFWSILVSLSAFAFLNYFQLVSDQYILHISVLSYLSAAANINLSSILAKQKILQTNLINFFQAFITLITLCVLFFLFNKENVSAYVNTLYVAFGSSMLISSVLLIPYIKNIDLKGLSQLIMASGKLGFYNQIGTVFQFLSLRMSYYFLNEFSGEEAVGIYSNSVSLAESVWLISASIATVQYPKIANTENKLENQALTLKLSKATLSLSFMAILILVCLPPSFFTWLFGPGFSGVSTTLKLISPGIFFYNFFLIIGHYFSGTGKYHINTIASIIGFIITLVLSFLLIPHFGTNEAAIVASFSFASTSLFVFWYFLKESGYTLANFIPNINDYKSLFDNIKLYFKPIK
jgi:O-antigen/teichoic acid export membrane protein